jgi:hypothetical protein
VIAEEVLMGYRGDRTFRRPGETQQDLRPSLKGKVTVPLLYDQRGYFPGANERRPTL